MPLPIMRVSSAATCPKNAPGTIEVTESGITISVQVDGPRGEKPFNTFPDISRAQGSTAFAGDNAKDVRKIAKIVADANRRRIEILSKVLSLLPNTTIVRA